jgi:hypothetical protein
MFGRQADQIAQMSSQIAQQTEQIDQLLVALGLQWLPLSPQLWPHQRDYLTRLWPVGQ